jgi:hypothetical protein
MQAFLSRDIKSKSDPSFSYVYLASTSHRRRLNRPISAKHPSKSGMDALLLWFEDCLVKHT